jgi:16S rRNA (cytidine1402-2'-O)-methyltransferase
VGPSSSSITWIVAFVPEAACAAKKPSRTVSAARANGVVCPGRIKAIIGGLDGGNTAAGGIACGCGKAAIAASAAGADAPAGTVASAVCGAGAAAAAGGISDGRVVGVCAHEDNANTKNAINHGVQRCDRRLAAFTMNSKSGRMPETLIEASGVTEQELPTGALYVVATPIGNAADITVRAWWVLSHVDAIAAEDTRVTRTLLDRYGISAVLIAVHEHNERAAAQRIVERLRTGQRIALVTDAGTPAISDPGARVVRETLASGLRVVPVPGASSFAAALSAAGIVAGDITFVGFLPSGASKRAERLRDIARDGGACVLFEAPHRFVATARALAANLQPDRRVVVARELTKKFETIVALTAAELGGYAQRTEPRGEYVLVIDAAAREAPAELDEPTRRWLAALAEALPASRAAAVAAKATGLQRDLLYRELTALRGDS